MATSRHPISNAASSTSLEAFFGPRPDWRWAAGKSIAQSLGITVKDDVLIQRVATFVAGNPEAPEGDGASDPELAAAGAMQRDAALTGRLKVLVVGGMEPAEICALMSISPTQLALWEGVFFDVRPRLSAPGWLIHYVIDPEFDAGDRQLAERLRLAVAGGSEIAKLLLCEELGAALQPSERIQLMELRVDLKMKEALLVPIRTASQVAKFTDQYIKIQQLQQEFELEKRRLDSQERQAERLHEGEMLRLQIELATLSTHVQDVGLRSKENSCEPMLQVFTGDTGASDLASGEHGSPQCTEATGRESLVTYAFVSTPTFAMPAVSQPQAGREQPPPRARSA